MKRNSLKTEFKICAPQLRNFRQRHQTLILCNLSQTDHLILIDQKHRGNIELSRCSLFPPPGRYSSEENNESSLEWYLDPFSFPPSFSFFPIRLFRLLRVYTDSRRVPKKIQGNLEDPDVLTWEFLSRGDEEKKL